MTLFFATFLTGAVLVSIGVLFLMASPAIISSLKAFPRSRLATIILFGGAAIWFLWKIWTLSEADFGEYRKILFVGFAAVALASFFCVPDFLAVRGLAALTLLAATPLLGAAYMQYDFPQRRFMVAAVYAGIVVAIYLGAVPFRLRDFLGWVFNRPGRSRIVGGTLAAYGFLLAAIAFTY